MLIVSNMLDSDPKALLIASIVQRPHEKLCSLDQRFAEALRDICTLRSDQEKLTLPVLRKGTHEREEIVVNVGLPGVMPMRIWRAQPFAAAAAAGAIRKRERRVARNANHACFLSGPCRPVCRGSTAVLDSATHRARSFDRSIWKFGRWRDAHLAGP